MGYCNPAFTAFNTEETKFNRKLTSEYLSLNPIPDEVYRSDDKVDLVAVLNKKDAVTGTPDPEGTMASGCRFVRIVHYLSRALSLSLSLCLQHRRMPAGCT